MKRCECCKRKIERVTNKNNAAKLCNFCSSEFCGVYEMALRRKQITEKEIYNRINIKRKHLQELSMLSIVNVGC
jgi:hypothetical protein